MLLVRHLGRFFADLGLFTVRSGRWWFSLVLLILIIASLLIVTAKTVVPVATYTLF